VTKMNDTLFDYAEGLRLAEQGMTAAIDHAGKDWREMAEIAVKTVGRLRMTFTADDVWEYIVSHNLPQPPKRVALGSVICTLSKRGAIRATGEWRNSARPETHTRPLRVWQAI